MNNEQSKISKSRKIALTAVGILTMFLGTVFFIGSCAGGCYGFDFSAIIFLSPIILGASLIVAGHIRSTILWIISMIFASVITTNAGMMTVNTGVYPGVIFISLLFIIFWVVLLILYLLHTFEKPVTLKKELIVIIFLMILPIISFIFGYIGGSLAQSNKESELKLQNNHILYYI